jgi:NitT/TauT family transport system substrate-binding protein
MSRRDFLKLSALFTSSFGAAIAAANWNLPVNANAKDQPVKIGYLPITDAAPLLVAHSRKLYQAEGLTTEQPRLFRSWAQIVEAFLARQVNVIHVLFPTSIWIRYARNFPAKIVAWNHTNGSALTVLPDIENPRELGGKTIAVPFWYSIHNLVLQQLLQRNGLKIVRKAKDAPIASNEVNLVVLPPPDMVSALANKSIGGYIVAEPFNAAAENLKTGRVLRFTGDVWKNHACCVVFVHEEDIKERKQWTQRVVNALVKAQLWSRGNRSEVARILSKDGGKYTPHPLPVLQRALTYYDRNFYKKDGAIENPAWQVNRIDFQPYPFPSYTWTSPLTKGHNLCCRRD